MLEFVGQGLGVALVADDMILNHPQLRAVPIDDSGLSWTLGVTSPDATPAARELLAMLG